MMGTNNLSFSFKFIDRKKIFNELQKPKSKKACQESDIPVKIIRENIDIIIDFIYNNVNNSLFSSYIPSNLKNADDITPVFNKKHCENVENYRQCGFCQGYSTQHCLLIMTEKWHQCLDKGDKWSITN